MPRVTIAMSVYNGLQPDYLKQSMESIISQSFDDYEFLIITDGLVNDGLKNIILDYEQKSDRIIFIENNPMGITEL